MYEDLGQFYRAFNAFRGLNEQFPINGCAIFLLIAHHDGGLTTAEISQTLHMKRATVAKNLRYMGQRAAADKEGLGLINMLYNDDADIRIGRAYLTTAGMALRDRILAGA